MNLDISLDLEEQVIRIIVDDSGTITAMKNHNNEGITYYRLNRLDSEESQEKIKQVCEILFSLEED